MVDLHTSMAFAISVCAFFSLYIAKIVYLCTSDKCFITVYFVFSDAKIVIYPELKRKRPSFLISVFSLYLFLEIHTSFSALVAFVT